jgi:hypothetical protein
LDYDGRPPKSRNQPVPFKEAAGAGVGAIVGLGEQAPHFDRPREHVVVGAGIRRVEPGRKNDHGPPSPIDRAFMRGPVHTDCTAGYDDNPVEYALARK